MIKEEFMILTPSISFIILNTPFFQFVLNFFFTKDRMYIKLLKSKRLNLQEIKVTKSTRLPSTFTACYVGDAKTEGNLVKFNKGKKMIYTLSKIHLLYIFI